MWYSIQPKADLHSLAYVLQSVSMFSDMVSLPSYALDFAGSY